MLPVSVDVVSVTFTNLVIIVDVKFTITAAQTVVLSSAMTPEISSLVPLCRPHQFHISPIRCDTRCYFNVCSKADMSHLNAPHGTDS